MPDIQRRVILKPADVDAGTLARLGETLGEAIELHNRLAAKSPHILRLTSSLQQNGSGFFVTHEPATPVDPRDLFGAGGAALPEEQLLQFANGLFEALAAAHASNGGRPPVHGGLCPGVVLTGEDGLVKIADFAVAPAICKALGAEQYLNLAISPRSDATGAWEILPEYVADRDDRLCGFVDPDKYGQDTLGSFETGSDIIAAGMVLFLLAERKHPYLYYEAEAHRVVDMARQMSMGVPIPIRRKDLCESADPAMRACRELVFAMLDREPSKRLSAAEILQRFRTAAPGADLELIAAQRWVKQIESLLQAKRWPDLQAALQDRPKLTNWPQDLLSRAVSVERQAQAQLAKLGEQAAIEADRLVAEKWLARVQKALQVGDWKATQGALGEKPELKHWPARVLEEITAVAARLEAEQAAEQARAWQKSLQKAFQARDWTAVARRFEQRPEPQVCPPEVLRYANEVEAEYKKYLEEQERRQRLIEQQHQQADTWLNEARGLAKNQKWVEAIDLLAQPPRLEHWPAGCRDAARRLTAECRGHLGDVVQEDLGKIEEMVRGHGEAVVRHLLATRFAGLLRPECVETKIELVLWAPPDTDADGRATLLTRVRAPRGLTEPEAVRGALDFKLRGREPNISAGLDEFRRLVEAGLDKTLRQLQNLQLGALTRALRDSIFPEVAVQATLEAPTPRATAKVYLLGEKATAGRVAAELSWDDAALAWQPADPEALAAAAIETADPLCVRALHADLVARCELARQHAEITTVTAEAKPAPVSGGLPKSLLLTARVIVTPEGGTAGNVYTGQVAVQQVGRATFGDALRDIESKLLRILIDAQAESLAALTDELKGRVRGSPTRIDVVAPKRSKTPTPALRFELKPKGGTPLACAAAWNPRVFAYQFSAEATRTVNELLARLGAAVNQEAAAAATKQAAEAARKADEARRKTEEAQRKTEEAAAKKAEAEARKAEEAAARAAALEARQAKEEAERQAEAEVRRKQEAERQAAAEARPAAAAERKEAVAVAEKPKSPPKPVAPRATTRESKVTEKPDRRSPKRRGLFLGVGVGAAAVIVLVVFLAFRGPGPGQTPPQNGPFVVKEPNKPVVEPNQVVVEPNKVVVEPNTVASEPNQPTPEPNTVVAEPNQPVAEPNTAVAEPNTPVTEPNTPVVEQTPPVVPEPSLADVKAGKLKALEQHRDAARDKARDGKLAAAHEELAAASGLAAELADEPSAAEVGNLARELPPSWKTEQPVLQAAGYAPPDGDTDADTGYPLRLRSSDGRVLALLVIGPTDKIWADVENLRSVIKPEHPLHGLLDVPAGQHPYRIFYIDSDEVAVSSFPTQSTPRRLPTREEWFLAALKTLGGSPTGLQNMVSGHGEWCSEPGATADGKQWVCGGGQLPNGRGLAPPKSGDELKKWWSWLTNPLVMQRRPANFGDDLTAARTVLPIFPAQ
jgi:serine/threonine protein kinase